MESSITVMQAVNGYLALGCGDGSVRFYDFTLRCLILPPSSRYNHPHLNSTASLPATAIMRHTKHTHHANH